MAISILRTVLIYFFVLAAIRFMGKREVGGLSPFDLVIAIMIAELAAIPLESNDIPLRNAIIPIAALVVLEIGVSQAALKHAGFRRIVVGEPTVLVEDGKAIEPNMRRLRYTISDLMTQLRDKDIFNISDVEFAILETSGKLNVLVKSQKRPVTPEDLRLATDYEGPSYPVISDGKISYQHLKILDMDVPQLRTKLYEMGIESIDDVFLAVIDSKGVIYVTLRGETDIAEIVRTT